MWERRSNLSQLKTVPREDHRYGKFEEVMINGRKCVKKDFEFVYPAGFTKHVEGKDLRKKFDPAFFAELIDFESGRYNTRSRRRRSSRSSRSSRSGSRSSRRSSRSGSKSGSSRSGSRSGSSSRSRGNEKEYTGLSKVKPSFWVTW